MKFLRRFDQLEPIRVWLVSFVPVVFDHGVPQQRTAVKTTSDQGLHHSPGQAGVVSGQFQVTFNDPNVEIIVLPSPAPVLVGESVHLSEVVH